MQQGLTETHAQQAKCSKGYYEHWYPAAGKEMSEKRSVSTVKGEDRRDNGKPKDEHIPVGKLPRSVRAGYCAQAEQHRQQPIIHHPVKQVQHQYERSFHE